MTLKYSCAQLTDQQEGVFYEVTTGNLITIHSFT